MKLKSLTIAIALAATSASTFAADKEEGFYIGAFGTLANWIAAPFNGVLSEKVERHLTGQAMGDDGLPEEFCEFST